MAHRITMIIEAPTFREGFDRFTGGYWAEIMTPTEIKKIRECAGLTQEQMAQLLGYGAAVRVSELERGVRNPSKSVIKILEMIAAGKIKHQ